MKQREVTCLSLTNRKQLSLLAETIIVRIVDCLQADRVRKSIHLLENSLLLISIKLSTKRVLVLPKLD